MKSLARENYDSYIRNEQKRKLKLTASLKNKNIPLTNICNQTYQKVSKKIFTKRSITHLRSILNANSALEQLLSRQQSICSQTVFTDTTKRDSVQSSECITTFRIRKKRVPIVFQTFKYPEEKDNHEIEPFVSVVKDYLNKLYRKTKNLYS